MWFIHTFVFAIKSGEEDFMEKKISYSGVIITVLAVAILVMSVGFAVFSANINFNGTANVSSTRWNVFLDESTYQKTEGSVESVSEPTINTNSMTYSVNLTKPGDFYEFTIHVKNTGSFNAKLKSLTMTDISEHSNYLKYTITYAGTPYTSSNSSLSIPLNAGTGDEEVKVRVEYVQPLQATDLPSELKAITLNAAFDYEQVA